ncbi:hypothetical protein GGX14DRAFT_456879 [Mycena pura]|uniref:Uncharacterized protein n=1 Tax=Mycena pura TaxID=153505 RepID=A0AAD6VDS5_9AGAR|nr:hypothetical protein GGX14DRAFT_456879 [Mycena pura]
MPRLSLSSLSIPKSASLVITLLGGLVHSFLALQLASSWRTLRALEAENEFEMGKFDGLRVLWALLALYLLAAAFVSFVGFLGVLRNNPTHVRLYRDCASADLLFTTFLGLIAAFAFWGPTTTSTRAACDAPELAPLLPLINSLLSWFIPAPLSPDEACERYLAQVGAGASAGLLILSVVRVHFLLAVNAHYGALLREARVREGLDAGDLGVGGAQRIRLLPLPRGVPASDVVYAPVHAAAAAGVMAAAEVWVRAAAPGSPNPSRGDADLPVYLQPDDAGLLDARVVRTKREWI